ILELELTLTGERVGTPRYMAPEQHARAGVTAAADQFAFANSLWSALYRAPPFTAQTLEELKRQAQAGPLVPQSSAVPARVGAALRRALSLRPEDRWPSLGHLLDELRWDPALARRRTLLHASVACAVISVGAAAFGLGRSAAPGLGDVEVTAAASLWDEPTREKTRAAFRRTARAYAEETFERVDASISGWSRDWTRAHQDACRAAEDGNAAAERFDARMACLGRSRSEMAALIGLLGDADADAVEHAAAAVDAVADVGRCAKDGAPSPPTPVDPDRRERIERLRVAGARVQALRFLGRG